MTFPLDAWSSCDRILTATQRLSSNLLKAYAQAGWVSPPAISTWEGWTQSLWEHVVWHSSSPQPTLMSRWACQTLWRHVVAQHDRSAPASVQETMATQAAQLAGWCHGAGRDPLQADPLYHDDPDWFLFLTWLKEVRAWEEAHHAFPPEALNARLAPLLGSDLLASQCPKRLLLVGFDQLWPTQTRVLDALEAQGTRWERHQGTTQATESQHTAPNTESAWYHAVSHAKAWLEEHPEGHYGLVLFNAPDHRKAFVRVLDAIFEQPSALKVTHKTQKPYHFSGGEPLAHQAVISSALCWLQGMAQPLSASWATATLQSPYHKASAHVPHHTLCAWLEAQSEHATWLWSDLLPQWTETQSLAQALSPLVPQPGEQKTTQAWMLWAQEVLTTVGWPGERVVNSQEFQAVQQWEQLLQCLAQHQPINPTSTAALWVSELVRHTSHTMHQSQDHDARLHVLGHLEVAGQPFDALWVCGMDDETFPPPAQPHPFMPLMLQRSWDMPHATAERQWRISQAWLDHLRTLSPELIYGHAAQHQERPLQISPLVRHVPPCTWAWAPLVPPAWPREPVPDSPVALRHEEGNSWSAQALMAQAVCPFKAFAAHRLRLSEPQEPERYPGPALRGQVLHACLATLGQEARNQDGWRALGPERMQAVVDHHVGDMKQHLHPEPWTELIVGVERERLLGLLQAWRLRELARDPFETVAVEAPQVWREQGQIFRFRIDRLDRTDQRMWLMDYKTRRFGVQAWLQEPLVWPQMPFYAQAMATPVSGVVLVTLNQDGMDWQSVHDDPQEGLVHHDERRTLKLSSSWEQLKASWRERAQEWVRAFKSGEVAVAPVDPSACRGCSWQGICRKEVSQERVT